jgi:hypothetical protein
MWLIENSVVELGDGRLLMFFRTSTVGGLYSGCIQLTRSA